MRTIIETERLILRPFTMEDIEPSYIMNLDSEINKYTGDGGVVSKAEIEKRITGDVMGDYKKHGFGRFAVELKGEDQFIGFCGLKYLEDMKLVDLGYRFLTKHWGKGLATEAGRACLHYGFEDLELEKIFGFVLPENTASIRVLEKLDFHFDEKILDEGLWANKYICLKDGLKT